MKQVVKTCLYCGTSFSSTISNKKFCSPRCCHYFHNRIGLVHKSDGGRVIREFMCKECGKHVMISDTKDRRTEFCNVQCCRNYYRHRRERNCTTNQGMSGGMSLGSLKRKEIRALR